MSRLLADRKDWDITILATDINSRYLEVANKGVYRNWSFRTTPPLMKERYFTPTAEGYAVIPEIKQMVTFAQLNLAEPQFGSIVHDGGGIDIIFCRNALMYFSPEGVSRVVANFHRSLVPGGWLIVNPSEATPSIFSQFETIVEPDVLLFRKGSGQQAPARRPAQLPQPVRPSFLDLAPLPPQVDRPRPRPIVERTTAQVPAKIESKQLTEGWEHARKLYDMAQFAEARERLITLAGQGTGDAPSFLLLANIEANAGRLAAALEWSERATRADSMNPAHWYLKATVLLEQGAQDEATTSLNRVLYLDPGFALAYLLLGNMSLQQGRKSEALKHFNNVRTQLRGQIPTWFCQDLRK